jgi:hypothetical protein
MATDQQPGRFETVIVLVALLAVATLLGLDLLRPSAGAVSSMTRLGSSQHVEHVLLDEPARR